MTDLQQVTTPTGMTTSIPLQHHNMTLYNASSNGVTRVLPMKQRRQGENSNDASEEEYTTYQQVHSKTIVESSSSNCSVRSIDNRNDTVDTTDSTAVTEYDGGESDHNEKTVSRGTEPNDSDQPTRQSQVHHDALPGSKQNVTANNQSPSISHQSQKRSTEVKGGKSGSTSPTSTNIVHTGQPQNIGQKSDCASQDYHENSSSNQSVSGAQQVQFRTLTTPTHDRPENSLHKYKFATQTSAEPSQYGKHSQANHNSQPQQSGQHSQQQQFQSGGKSQYRSVTHPTNISVSRVALSPSGVRSREGTIDTAPPLFERLFTSEESQDAKTYSRIISTQNRRLLDLERVHDELETRLEEQTKARMDLEADLDRQCRLWSQRFEALEKDRDEWKNRVSDEQNKNEQLLKQINHKEKEIHRMIQHKYDVTSSNMSHGALTASHRRRPGSNQNAEGVGPNGTPPTSRSNKFGEAQYKSPREILSQTGTASTVRERNAASTLMDFFGIKVEKDKGQN